MLIEKWNITVEKWFIPIEKWNITVEKQHKPAEKYFIHSAQQSTLIVFYKLLADN